MAFGMGLLSVKLNLQQRGLDIDGSCPVCANHDESIFHVFHLAAKLGNCRHHG
ncbi:hypothetical protein COLO4_27237 [Corchorus olitorius]|uniref:Uncharacterized protein n=1 Tax=Corchorus olitorius TaxID=93759 RepID=A0A1R3HSB9_9ROSI|nr:hypothetical protein COLO4_27237 [Corchorus olitorius]